MTPPLARSLERLLADHFGRRRAIRTLSRRRHAMASTFTLEELDVEFSDGGTLALVMKVLGPSHMRTKDRSRREIDVYRTVLPDAPPGTAVCYGALASGRRHRLFLERVDGVDLPQAASLSAWARSAEWIARFHRIFRGPRLARVASRAALPAYDGTYYRLWLERAYRFAADDRRRRVLDRVARAHESIVARLLRMPDAIVHGDFYPSNVMIGGTPRRLRVCPVDWEMTAVGPALMDLAALVTGWPEPQRRALVRAYRTAADVKTRSRRASREFATDLDCCRLHLAVRMLGWSRGWTPPPQQAYDWTGEALGIVKRLQA
jgi:hypothetical protein